MSEKQQTVEPLKKLRLTLEVETDSDKAVVISQPVPIEFIFGAGSQGLSPFEFQLAGKKEGDVFRMNVRGDELPDLFQHLPLPPLPRRESDDAFYIKVKIMKVSEADPKEVIKAMAEAGACGDHCCGH
jgi:hypothetical protein